MTANRPPLIDPYPLLQRTVMATLRPCRVGGDKYGYLYDVIVAGETIVRRSHDPEHDACRALLARGVTGRLTLTNMSGTPRSSLDIENAAPWSVIEDDKRGLLVVRFKKWPGSVAVVSPEAEAEPVAIGMPSAAKSAQGKRPLQSYGNVGQHRETDDGNPHVVLEIGDHWRIVGCREDLQWIVQSRAGSAWRSHGYCRSRVGLRALLHRNGLDPATTGGFPEMYPEGRRAVVGQQQQEPSLALAKP